VDVGSMDATLHLGFQRSVASLWQQAGRAGRRGGTSLSIYVAWDSPLDQWLLQQPERLFEMPLETNLINMANQHILQPHLLAAGDYAHEHFRVVASPKTYRVFRI
jgi:DEAD/DEAH box helicase domain-containing protein